MYRFCFSNSFSSVTSKTISVYLQKAGGVVAKQGFVVLLFCFFVVLLFCCFLFFCFFFFVLSFFSFFFFFFLFSLSFSFNNSNIKKNLL